MNKQRRIVLGAVGTLAVGSHSIHAIGADARVIGDGSANSAPRIGKSTIAPNAPAVIASRYKPSFVDDFSNTDLRRFSEQGTVSVDGAPAWRTRYRHPRKDVINKEKQIYVDSAYAGTGDKPLGINPFLLRKGTLTIVVEPADPVKHSPFLYGMKYTSGAITTELSHTQQYGFFEMRARLPLGRGFWPSFWLMPVRDAWPPEIDIIEASGARPGKGHFAVRNPGDKKGFASDWIDIGEPIDGWRNYQCEWTRDRIAFFVDGKQYWQKVGHKIHEPMYILANLALGSHDRYWIPDPDATTPFPGLMEIDYIRAFSRA